jgi:hypothetical protein
MQALPEFNATNSRATILTVHGHGGNMGRVRVQCRVSCVVCVVCNVVCRVCRANTSQMNGFRGGSGMGKPKR